MASPPIAAAHSNDAATSAMPPMTITAALQDASLPQADGGKHQYAEVRP